MRSRPSSCWPARVLLCALIASLARAAEPEEPPPWPALHGRAEIARSLVDALVRAHPIDAYKALRLRVIGNQEQLALLEGAPRTPEWDARMRLVAADLAELEAALGLTPEDVAVQRQQAGLRARAQEVRLRIDARYRARPDAATRALRRRANQLFHRVEMLTGRERTATWDEAVAAIDRDLTALEAEAAEAVPAP